MIRPEPDASVLGTGIFIPDCMVKSDDKYTLGSYDTTVKSFNLKFSQATIHYTCYDDSGTIEVSSS